MNELNILNAGRGDCIVCLFEEDGTQRCAVVDGGRFDCDEDRVLIDFLHKKGIDTIDLLVLTHVHMDHFSGMCLLDEGIKVRQAVTPCGDMTFSQRIMDGHQEDERWLQYHRVMSYLEKTADSMMTSREASGRVIRFGDYWMQCIYPLPETEQPATDAIWKVAAAAPGEFSEEEEDRLYAIYKTYCNADSSIWTVGCRDRQIALLAGDSTEAAMAQALAAYPFHPEVLKLSHHGINVSQGVTWKYFSPEQIKAIDAQVVVVTNGAEMAETVVPECEALGAKKLHYAWTGDFQYLF